MARDRAAGRLLARTWRRVPAGWQDGSTVATGLALWVVAWWLVIAGTVALMVPAPAASAPPAGFIVAPGQTARIHQPGLPDWPIPADRQAYDEYQRGARESDEDAVERAFTAFEWIRVTDGLAVRIVDVNAEAVQVELLEGPNAGRRGWLKARHLRP